MGTGSKRLDYLLRLTADARTGGDPFVWYGLAMEYRSLGLHEDAVATFATLRARSPDYVPMYLMCGQVLERMGRVDDAREWLAAGAQAADRAHDPHAASELRAALDALG